MHPWSKNFRLWPFQWRETARITDKILQLGILSRGLLIWNVFPHAHIQVYYINQFCRCSRIHTGMHAHRCVCVGFHVSQQEWLETPHGSTLCHDCQAKNLEAIWFVWWSKWLNLNLHQLHITSRWNSYHHSCDSFYWIKFCFWSITSLYTCFSISTYLYLKGTQLWI